jgi:hypothetical protein
MGRLSSICSDPSSLWGWCSCEQLLIIANMMLKIEYFAEPSAPAVKPAVLLAVSGQFAIYGDALLTAQQTARDLEAHSFRIDWPGGTSDHYLRDGDGWKLK